MSEESRDVFSNVYLQSAVLQAMLMVMAADDVLADEEITALQDLYRAMTSAELSVDMVREEVAHRNQGRQLADLAPPLDDKQRQMVLWSACWMAVADDRVQAAEESVLGEVADALGLGAADVKTQLERVGAP